VQTKMFKFVPYLGEKNSESHTISNCNGNEVMSRIQVLNRVRGTKNVGKP